MLFECEGRIWISVHSSLYVPPPPIVDLKKTANTVPLLLSRAVNMTHTKFAKYKGFYIKIYSMIFSCSTQILTPTSIVTSGS
jgi:hypothetical protein